jgi:hypothetical protein
MRMGGPKLRQFAAGLAPALAVNVLPRSSVGVEYPAVLVKKQPLAPVALMGTDPSFDEARMHLRELAELLAKLGEAETALRRLLVEQRKTQKRVNALNTREDHPRVASQLFASYAKALEVRNLAAIIGAEELSEGDRRYLAFANAFEQRFVGQGENDDRSISETLSIGWEVLSMLPAEALTRVSEEDLGKYHGLRREIGSPAHVAAA